MGGKRTPEARCEAHAEDARGMRVAAVRGLVAADMAKIVAMIADEYIRRLDGGGQGSAMALRALRASVERYREVRGV